jgi:hypothetical protein
VAQLPRDPGADLRSGSRPSARTAVSGTSSVSVPPAPPRPPTLRPAGVMPPTGMRWQPTATHSPRTTSPRQNTEAPSAAH